MPRQAVKQGVEVVGVDEEVVDRDAVASDGRPHAEGDEVLGVHPEAVAAAGAQGVSLNPVPDQLLHAEDGVGARVRADAQDLEDDLARQCATLLEVRSVERKPLDLVDHHLGPPVVQGQEVHVRDAEHGLLRDTRHRSVLVADHRVGGPRIEACQFVHRLVCLQQHDARRSRRGLAHEPGHHLWCCQIPLPANNPYLDGGVLHQSSYILYHEGSMPIEQHRLTLHPGVVGPILGSVFDVASEVIFAIQGQLRGIAQVAWPGNNCTSGERRH
mmetsp:Transcript_45833/g.132728  ORF Transcript_45833/g.132728 Transcript_45833/m.132728 type:complete len:271 (-) Transcript_45833:952-1764(-)